MRDVNRSAISSDSIRTLSARRVASRGLIGLVSRGSQGLLLALAIHIASAEDAARLAIVLTVSATVNLISNVGIPTMIVRSGRQLWPADERLALGRAYAWLSVGGGVIAAGAVAVLGCGPTSAFVGGALCFWQSVYYGIEYWCLANGDAAYDTFLKRIASMQSLISLGSPAVMWLSGSVTFGSVALAASFFVGSTLALLRMRSGLLSVRLLLGRPQLGRRWFEAGSIGLATIAVALVYSADAVVLRLSSDAQSLAGYRLALLCVNFLVALLPVGILVLADVSSGKATEYLKMVVVGVSYTAICIILGLVMWLDGGSYERTGICLMLLAPLALLRLLSQVLISDLNANGYQRKVASAFGVGLALWASVLVYSYFRAVDVTILACVQCGIECVIMGGLVLTSRMIKSNRNDAVAGAASK